MRYEIEEILVTDRPPEKWTYPDIQPRLLDAAQNAMDSQQLSRKG